MARKASANGTGSRGLCDVIGLVLIALGLVLLLAQISFDRLDVAANRFPPNQTPHNWIGQAGASLAYFLFLAFGAGAFVLPFLAMLFGVGYLFEFFSYLKRRWAWATVLFVCCIGLLDLYTNEKVLEKMALQPALPAAGWMEHLAFNLNSSSAGGHAGHLLNETLFGRFGIPGATILFATLYLISLIYLTNFGLGAWLRHWWAHRGEAPAEEEGDWSSEERALARRARDLEKQARRLQDQVERSGLGPDLKPVPAPTVRDLSVPQARSGNQQPSRDREGAVGKPKPAEAPGEKVGLDGEVIPAHEVAAATTDQVLGKQPETTPDRKSVV